MTRFHKTSRQLRSGLVSLFLLAFVSHVLADGPADNIPDKVRRVPKLGIEPNGEQREKLESGLTRLDQMITELGKRNDPRTIALLPDVEIYRRAVHDALKYQEFFRPREIDDAAELLNEGRERAASLLKGQSPWADQQGLVVRGYVSKIDGSVQPYGLVIPKSYTHRTAGRYRLDIWFHGRGETLSEVNFLTQRRKNPGTFTPPDTIVLHPYGRYSNAFKFAGEVDVLEALESVKQRYRVDEDRISVRGFSMGGAACWQFAVHYSDRWFAANPGAGFSETPEFLKFFQKETLNPTWWEKKLWHMYDCTDWAGNLRHCPTVAYSGELDIQKQAADIMEVALKKEHIDLIHIIGPATKHRYHPDSRNEVERRIANIAAKGRVATPRLIEFKTYTLKYNKMAWIQIDGLIEHWKPSFVTASLEDGHGVFVDTENVSDLTIHFPPGTCTPPREGKLYVDMIGYKEGKEDQVPAMRSDRSWTVKYHMLRGHWRLGPRKESGLRKRHNLQGPIDDAFMDSFIFVRPTGKARHELVGKWSASELERAIEHWRRHFRGHARVKNDTDISSEDIASANLVLWGDPASNQLLGRIAGKLPIAWKEPEIVAVQRRYPADTHALIAIYPNPLNPKRYVVLNSSFTYREYAYLNNARQVPMLPDWAVVDLRTPPDTRWPGKIVDADFFDERWQLRPVANRSEE